MALYLLSLWGMATQLLRMALLLPVLLIWCEQLWAAGASVQQSPEAFCAQFGQVFDAGQYACIPDATKPATEAMQTLLGESGETTPPAAGGPLVGLTGTVIDAATIESSVGMGTTDANAGSAGASSGQSAQVAENPACHNGIMVDGCEDGTATLCTFIPHRAATPASLIHMCYTAALLFGLGVLRKKF